MENKVHILLFYKYVEIEDVQKFVIEHKEMCKRLGLYGRILVAKEGINGSVAGTVEQTEAYKEMMLKDARFSDMQFKEDIGISIPFRKMIVKSKREIVTFGQNVDLNNTGKHLTPKEFKEICESGDPDIVILDARNNYESKVGKFKNAITPDIEKFSEFPKVVDGLKDKKDKKIVMYCTGGIRCEKASAYMKEQGFKDVSQLKGGILTYGKEFPDTIWEGTCFVFDRRLTSTVNNEAKPITSCENCGILCDLCKNCKNTLCDKYIIQCTDCKHLLNGCCTKKCMAEHKRMRDEKSLQVSSE